MRLPTFVHVSDLHIGLLDEESLNARTRLCRKWPMFEGMLGHSFDSLMDLKEFVENEFFPGFAQDNPDLYLIVTGDLTAIGHAQEFDIANQYLSGVLRDLGGKPVGLGVSDWNDRAIPGNHDHWPGLPVIIGRPTRAFKRYFPHMPATDPVFQLGRGLQLRLLRINTDADVNPFLCERIMAIGSFVSQLNQLSSILDVLGPNESAPFVSIILQPIAGTP